MTRGSADVIGEDADTPLHFLQHKQLTYTSMYNISIQTMLHTTRTLLPAICKILKPIQNKPTEGSLSKVAHA